MEAVSGAIFTWTRQLRPDYIFRIMEEMPEHLGHLEMLVMLALLRLGEEAYGVTIGREIEKKGRRPAALASVYAVLERLERRGWVRSEVGEATPERGGRAKHHFRLTAQGLKELKRSRAALIGMWQGLPELA
jgi:PadR family transcriptional regulator, regulatory protein PadR